MKNKTTTLSKMRILITNDDSIHANGIKALEKIANNITPDVWVVAPEVGQSGKGFSVTFDDILRVKESAYNQLLGMFNPVIKKSEFKHKC